MRERGVCALQYALGQVERCPGAQCPLWLVEPGRAGCVLESVAEHIERSPELASYLLDVRGALERAAAPSCDARVRSFLSQRLNQEQVAESA